MAGLTHGTNRSILSAQLLARVEPRRVTQCRPETARYDGGAGQNQTWPHPNGGASSAQRAETATTRSELLSAQGCHLCRLVAFLQGRINKVWRWIAVSGTALN